ncbi:MAG: thiamine pyrophosphate-dependent dehydrogenase E1 component subunit alpha [Proteobacteria bacterium]|nr:thiamine pyrophosphate-dependent dehydrogenase E1 component subunit alpha [Pseudomonadota bacterium]
MEGLTKEMLLAMYDALLKSRLVEDKLIDVYARGDIPGIVHSAVGQEAIPVGATFHLRPGDVFTTVRGHIQSNIVMGMDLKKMFAEFYGKEAGYCKGKGGEIHLCSPEYCNIGGRGLIGATIPMAAGAAMAFKMRKEPHIAMCFFGDGASNEGNFHEGLNLASVFRLPVVYVCANNQYAMTTRQVDHMNIRDIADRAASYGIPGVMVDGNDIIAVYEAVGEAVSRARRGEGPTLIEAKTMRMRGHYEGDPEPYRSKDELEEWKKKDPLDRFTKKLLEDKVLTPGDVEKKSRQFMNEINEAIQFAKEAPFPDASEVTSGVFYQG